MYLNLACIELNWAELSFNLATLAELRQMELNWAGIELGFELVMSQIFVVELLSVDCEMMELFVNVELEIWKDQPPIYNLQLVALPLLNLLYSQPPVNRLLCSQPPLKVQFPCSLPPISGLLNREVPIFAQVPQTAGLVSIYNTFKTF